MRKVLPIVIALAIAAPAVAAEKPADRAGAAVKRGLTFLTRDALDWKAGRGCATCHHAPMMIWTLSEARTLGYRINEEALAEVLTWVVDPEDKAKTYPPPRKPDAPKILSFSPLNHALAIGYARRDSDTVRAGWERFLDTLVADQHDDGAWRQGPGGRPPMNGEPGVMTAWTLLALTPPGKPELKDSVKASRRKGLDWLAKTPIGDDFREEALRLMLAARLGASGAEREALARRLAARQKADGGWSQTKELPGDAYATGLSLYALRSAGVAIEGAALTRGREFLISSQRDDGSWPMASRPVGDYPPASDLRPITYAGSAWATLGLMRSAAGE
ncbi:MAG: terpene cyclase/mutase family protein [Planctomycetia bacterium]|nr:terpene cyclase/mutase family protein [Planctomycetia bacterium]